MQNTEKLPQKPGITTVESEAKSLVSYIKKPLGKYETLTELSKDYLLFTHATLFVFGNWTTDPVNDFVNRHAVGCPIYLVVADRPVFSGLSFKDRRQRWRSEWNYNLMLCPREYANDLIAFLQTVVGISYVDKRYYEAVLQKVPMVDFQALGTKSVLPSPLPMVDVVTVSLLGMDRTVYFEPAVNPPLDKVKVQFLPADSRVVRTGKALISGDMKSLDIPTIDLSTIDPNEVEDE